MNEFYAIEPIGGMIFGTKWAYADIIEPSNSGPSQKCPVCGGAVGRLKWLPPHKIKLSSAKPDKWGDFVWGAGFPLLVSSKFKSIYNQEGLTGIDNFSDPVEIVRIGTLKSGVYPTPPPIYHLIQVPWGGANQDDAASGLTHERPEEIKCSYCRVGVTWRKQERVVIEEGSWNGKDIFKPRKAPVKFLTSKKFKQIIETYQLTNIWFIPAEKYAYDERRTGLWYVNE